MSLTNSVSIRLWRSPSPSSAFTVVLHFSKLTLSIFLPLWKKRREKKISTLIIWIVLQILKTCRKESLSVCVTLAYPQSCSPDLLYTWWVYCWGPKGEQCWVWGHSDEQFLRMLQAAVPQFSTSLQAAFLGAKQPNNHAFPITIHQVAAVLAGNNGASKFTLDLGHSL